MTSNKIPNFLLFYILAISLSLYHVCQCVRIDTFMTEHISVEKNNTFEIACNDMSKLKACIIMTPYNRIYSVNYRYNKARFEGGRVFISLEDKYKCVVTVKHANETDVGKWQLIVPISTVNGYENKKRIFSVHLYTKSNHTFIFISLSLIATCMLVCVIIIVYMHVILK